MPTRRRDDQIAVTSYVDTGAKHVRSARYITSTAGMLEQVMLATAACSEQPCQRQWPVAFFQLSKSFVAVVAGIDINNHDAADRSGLYSDVRTATHPPLPEG